jgi:hypothetical protein
MWYSSERVTDRYGAFYLSTDSYEGKKPKAKHMVDTGAVNKFVGQRVRIVAKVIENRPSGHIGDAFHGLSPDPLDAGKELELAIGRFAIRQEDGHTFFEVRPDDGRSEFWIDPRKFFQLHDQTVEIYAELSTAPAHPPFNARASSSDEVIDNGDGTFQSKTKTPDAKFAIEPTVENLGGGTFIMSMPARGKGIRHKLSRR